MSDHVQGSLFGEASPGCSCLASDAWRCARALRLVHVVACPCICHRSPTEITPRLAVTASPAFEPKQATNPPGDPVAAQAAKEAAMAHADANATGGNSQAEYLDGIHEWWDHRRDPPPSREAYELWRTAWAESHPGRTPMDYDTWSDMILLFGIDPGMLLGPENPPEDDLEAWDRVITSMIRGTWNGIPTRDR
jgi:hypothetical protein